MIPFFLFMCVAIGLLFFFSYAVNDSNRERNINDIMKTIMKSGKFDSFSLIKKTEQEQHYYYGENHYKLTIVATETQLTFTTTHDSTILVYVVYNTIFHSFNEKTLSPKLINEFKADVKVIESFIQWIVSNEFQVD